MYLTEPPPNHPSSISTYTVPHHTPHFSPRFSLILSIPKSLHTTSGFFPLHLFPHLAEATVGPSLGPATTTRSGFRSVAHPSINDDSTVFTLNNPCRSWTMSLFIWLWCPFSAWVVGSRTVGVFAFFFYSSPSI